MQTWMVTGANRGLGRALTEALVGRGHTVLACGRSQVALEALAATLKPGCAHPFAIDLAEAAQVALRMNTLLAEHGPIDGVINNAGIGSYKGFLEHSESELLAIIQVNLIATMQICRAVLPGMLARGRGHIVNIGSDLGRRPLAQMAPYVASKHGLTGFTHSLLREVKSRGLRVSLVNTGIIDTDFDGGASGQRDPNGCLHPAALAALILQLIEQPVPLLVDEISVHPIGQAEF